MFGLFKKKKKNEYTPSFGTVEDFMAMYAQGDKHIVVGQYDGMEVGVTAASAPANDLVIINDDQKSVENQCVIPTLTQCKLSYVVYDPDGEYHNSIGEKMKANGYDVQVVDFADVANGSRLDLFEIANITKNPYWTSVVLASSLKCSQDEIFIAHNLLMAMMQYLLASENKITIENLGDIFNKIVTQNEEAVQLLQSCPTSRQYIAKIIDTDAAIMGSVFKKINNRFFESMKEKLKNPNIFTVTAHKKQTVIFIKRVPQEYKHLVTALLFNLKTSSVVCGNGIVNTLIIDTAEDEWYNRNLLDRICQEAGSIVGKGIAHMTIRGTIKPEFVGDDKKLLIYMHSDDADTKKYVYCYLPMDMQLSKFEKEEILKQHYKGKMKESTLMASPISMEELGMIDDCIVIDTSRSVRPFRCDRLMR